MNDSGIARLVAKTKRYTVNFGEGLYLRISPTGHKSWVYRTYIMGSSHDITLGQWPVMKTAQAKQALRQKKLELSQKPSIGATFYDAFKLWKKKKHGFIVSYEHECRRIEQYLLPKLGKLPVDTITAPVALGVLSEINGKLPTVRRLCMRLNEIMELAVCAGLISSNPCRKIGRVFAQHHAVNRPFIPWQRLPDYFALCREQPLWVHCLFLWAAYSGLRPIECVSVRYKWIKEGTLELPAAVMKKRRVHRVPLCRPVLRMLNIIRKERVHRSECVWCFSREQHISRQYISRMLNRSELNGKLCHHGLRATLRTWMQEQNVPHEIAEDALAHVSGTAVSRAYIRTDYLEQRREIMERWWTVIWHAYKVGCTGDSVCEELCRYLE